MLIALDPGLNSPGIAVFCDEGMLIRAARKDTSAFKDLPDGARWLEVARVLAGIVGKYTGGPQRNVTLVFERPQFYTRAKSKGDPNKLVGVTGVAACLVGILSCRYMPLEVFSPTPAEWIGQLSKVCPYCNGKKGKGRGKARVLCPECKGSDWETPRGRRIRSRLSPAELALVPDQNDAIDAVGLGLFKLGRLTPRSVLSNGRDGR
jgi:hypothetical protein